MILGIPHRATTTTATTTALNTLWQYTTASLRRTKVVHPCRYMSSHWTSYDMAPPDPIIGLNEAYQKDPHPNKVIVGVGAYRDDNGKPYVFPSVRIAEQRMMDQQLDMEYSGIVRIFI